MIEKATPSLMEWFSDFSITGSLENGLFKGRSQQVIKGTDSQQRDAIAERIIK